MRRAGAGATVCAGSARSGRVMPSAPRLARVRREAHAERGQRAVELATLFVLSGGD